MNATWSVASRKLITAGAGALLAVAWCLGAGAGGPRSAATQTKQRRSSLNMNQACYNAILDGHRLPVQRIWLPRRSATSPGSRITTRC